jgi:hypothetical protein
MRIEVLHLGLALALGLGGCKTASEERIIAPAARVDGMVVSGGGGSLSLRFTNPNSLPLVVSSSSHRITLGVKSLGVIDDEEPIGLPPLGTVEHRVVMPPKVALAARGYLLNNPGAVPVSVKSALLVTVSEDDMVTLISIGTGLFTAPQ